MLKPSHVLVHNIPHGPSRTHQTHWTTRSRSASESGTETNSGPENTETTNRRQRKHDAMHTTRPRDVLRGTDEESEARNERDADDKEATTKRGT